MLYDWLAERTPDQSISHKQMPTMESHIKFVVSRPYAGWYLIRSNGVFVDNIYMTRHREVGIHIGTGHQGKGYGTMALQALVKRHPGRLLANINPKNDRSIQFFKRRGAQLIQQTYEIPEEGPCKT